MRNLKECREYIKKIDEFEVYLAIEDQSYIDDIKMLFIEKAEEFHREGGGKMGLFGTEYNDSFVGAGCSGCEGTCSGTCESGCGSGCGSK